MIRGVREPRFDCICNSVSVGPHTLPDEKSDTVHNKCITLCKNFMIFILCKYRSCCGLSVGSLSNARQHLL